MVVQGLNHLSPGLICKVYDLEPEVRQHYPEIDERNEGFLRALKRKVAR